MTQDAQTQRSHPAGGVAVAYAAVFAASTAAAALYLQPWVGTDSSIFPMGVDWLWQQAMFQVHGLAGPLGVTDHLAYPIGISGWALPQLGLLAGMFAWLTVGVVGIPAAAGVIWFQCLSAGLDSLAVLFALRAFPAGRRGPLPLVIAVAMGASLWTLSHQLNLALFALVPVVLGQLARWEASRRTGLPVIGLVVLAAASVVSPLWWVVVLALLLPAVALTPLLRRAWTVLRFTLLAWAAVLLGLAAQTLLFLWRSGPGADASRLPWQSNYFGGHLVDLLLGSPVVADILPRAERLAEGATLDVSWGIAMVALGTVSLIVLVRIPPRRVQGIPTLVLAGTTVASTLYWLSGGLGNLQAGIAVLLGTTSPARVWYRMLLVLAVVGGMWVVAALSRSSTPRRFEGTLLTTGALLLLLTWVVDLGVARREYTPPVPATQYTAMVENVRRNVAAGCPVAQLPNETVPNERVTTVSFSKDPLTYRIYLPFALAPEFRWSGGSFVAGQTAEENPVTGVAVEATKQDFETLRREGFCAVLFDKGLSQKAQEQGVDIEGRTLDASVGPPVWQDDTYALYVLR